MKLFLLGGVEVESELESESMFSGRNRSRSWSRWKSVDSAALLLPTEGLAKHSLPMPEESLLCPQRGLLYPQSGLQ